LGSEGQYEEPAARSVRSLSRLRGRVGVGVPPAGDGVGDWRERRHLTQSWTRGESPTRLASLGTLPRKRESTTMVWPVMKVEASEAR